MEIPINAEVKCTDGVCGRSTYIVVNPANQQITHIVVKLAHWPHAERLVPIELVRKGGANTLELDCTCAHVITLQHFIDTHYVRETFPNPVSPGALPMSMVVSKEYYRIPEGELALQKGAHVEAADGALGRVDEFMVDPATDQITHLIVHEGHLWGQHNITIPVSAVDRIEANVVHLKLDKRALNELLPSTLPQAVDKPSHR